MKYLTAFLSGVVSVVLLSFFATPLLSEIYADYFNVQPGPDGESELADFLIFWQWPAFFALGFFLGYIIHTKCLTHMSLPPVNR
ncbi:hypothetical protein GCM10007414_39610 [Agarivorans gilvus]|uniref:Uncharacterized protein n=1 Tax=Agarivorans gilvus TaxID=680279 RepID=A0ABQ1I805_9ALTE|nr:hypothetical protein GCM10007414_39610 [Agarivorans gilvus]